MVAAIRISQHASPWLPPLVLANAGVVSTLYWTQAVVGSAVAEFGPSPWVLLMPGATLAGYAAGVAWQATLARDLTDPRAMTRHFALLVAALLLAASAPSPFMTMVACIAIGLGCSITQRLLATATMGVMSAARSHTIGWIIAGGLCGIVIARALVPVASQMLGWRWVLCIAAGLAAVSLATTRSPLHPQSTAVPPPPRAVILWRQNRVLRWGALQQALVFAVFNLGWALYPRLLAGSPAPSWHTASVAGLGAAFALISGRLCVRYDADMVARAGLVAVLLGGAALIQCGSSIPLTSLAMAVLDAGTQVALVANQTRVQREAPTNAVRGRLTAMVTTIAFLGGAVGAAVGNLWP